MSFEKSLCTKITKILKKCFFLIIKYKGLKSRTTMEGWDWSKWVQREEDRLLRAK